MRAMTPERRAQLRRYNHCRNPQRSLSLSPQLAAFVDQQAQLHGVSGSEFLRELVIEKLLRSIMDGLYQLPTLPVPAPLSAVPRPRTAPPYGYAKRQGAYVSPSPQSLQNLKQYREPKAP